MEASTLSEVIERQETVQTYLARLSYALDHGARIHFQMDRRVDEGRDIRYTNRYTMADLFPDKNPVEVLKRELRTLSVKNYIKTVTDTTYPDRSPMYEFGKVYETAKEVYIKIRVETVESFVFVMSFHYSSVPFAKQVFPYC